MSDPRAVIMDWFDGLWIKRDETVIDRLRGEESRSTGIERNETVGRDGFKEFFHRFHRSFEAVTFEFKQWVVAGDDVAVHIVFTLTRAGQTARIDGAGFATVTDGRIVRAHNVWNLGDVARVFGVPHAEDFGHLLSAVEAQAK